MFLLPLYLNELTEITLPPPLIKPQHLLTHSLSALLFTDLFIFFFQLLCTYNTFPLSFASLPLSTLDLLQLSVEFFRLSLSVIYSSFYFPVFSLIQPFPELYLARIYSRKSGAFESRDIYLPTLFLRISFLELLVYRSVLFAWRRVFLRLHCMSIPENVNISVLKDNFFGLIFPEYTSYFTMQTL